MPNAVAQLDASREPERIAGLYDVLAALVQKITAKASTTTVTEPSRVIVEISREIRLSHAAVLQQERAIVSAALQADALEVDAE
jgi:hypothetical protein